MRRLLAVTLVFAMVVAGAAVAYVSLQDTPESGPAGITGKIDSWYQILQMEKTGYRILHRAKPINCFSAVRNAIAWEEEDFGARVHAKRVKYHRARLKFQKAQERRLSPEFPSAGSKINAD